MIKLWKGDTVEEVDSGLSPRRPKGSREAGWQQQQQQQQQQQKRQGHHNRPICGHEDGNDQASREEGEEPDLKRAKTDASPQRDAFEGIPDELLASTLTYIDRRDLGDLKRVSRRWRDVIDGPFLAHLREGSEIYPQSGPSLSWFLGRCDPTTTTTTTKAMTTPAPFHPLDEPLYLVSIEGSSLRAFVTLLEHLRMYRADVVPEAVRSTQFTGLRMALTPQQSGEYAVMWQMPCDVLALSQGDSRSEIRVNDLLRPLEAYLGPTGSRHEGSHQRHAQLLLRMDGGVGRHEDRTLSACLSSSAVSHHFGVRTGPCESEEWDFDDMTTSEYGRATFCVPAHAFRFPWDRPAELALVVGKVVPHSQGAPRAGDGRGGGGGGGELRGVGAHRDGDMDRDDGWRLSLFFLPVSWWERPHCVTLRGPPTPPSTEPGCAIGIPVAAAFLDTQRFLPRASLCDDDILYRLTVHWKLDESRDGGVAWTDIPVVTDMLLPSSDIESASGATRLHPSPFRAISVFNGEDGGATLRVVTPPLGTRSRRDRLFEELERVRAFSSAADKGSRSAGSAFSRTCTARIGRGRFPVFRALLACLGHKDLDYTLHVVDHESFHGLRARRTPDVESGVDVWVQMPCEVCPVLHGGRFAVPTRHLRGVIEGCVGCNEEDSAELELVLVEEGMRDDVIAGRLTTATLERTFLLPGVAFFTEADVLPSPPAWHPSPPLSGASLGDDGHRMASFWLPPHSLRSPRGERCDALLIVGEVEGRGGGDDGGCEGGGRGRGGEGEGGGGNGGGVDGSEGPSGGAGDLRLSVFHFPPWRHERDWRLHRTFRVGGPARPVAAVPMCGWQLALLSDFAASPECIVRLTLAWRHIRAGEDVGLSRDRPIVADILLEGRGVALRSTVGFEGMDGACVRMVFTPPNTGGHRDIPDDAEELARMLSIRSRGSSVSPTDGVGGGGMAGREGRCLGGGHGSEEEEDGY